MSPTATLNKIIELSSCQGDDFIEGCNNQGELELLHFFGLDEKKSNVSYEERFKEYNFFVKNFENTDLIGNTFSNEKIIELYDCYITNYSTLESEWLELLYVRLYESIWKNKQLFSKVLFFSMNAYVSASPFLNESYAFRVYSLMSNLDFYEINWDKEGFLEFFIEDYDNLDIDKIFINLKDDKEEKSERLYLVYKNILKINKEKSERQINNEKILKKFGTWIFHLAKYFDDIEELKEVYEKILELQEKHHVYDIWTYISLGIITSKLDIYRFIKVSSFSGWYFKRSKKVFDNILELSEDEVNKIISVWVLFEKNKLYEHIDLLSYSKLDKYSRDKYLEYKWLFVTKKQKEYFTIDWFIKIDDSEKEFIKQSIKHLKDWIIKYKIIPENLKKSVYLIEMISWKSKKEVIEIMDLEKEIPKLKEVFTEKFSEKILIKKESNLSIDEKNIINSFLLKYIKWWNWYRETNDIANHIFFEEIDKYLEWVLFNLSKYNQEHTDTFKLIQTYLKFDIDKTNLSEELAILWLLTRHFKDKKLKEFLSKIILNEIYLISPHLKEFFGESMVDDLDWEKYIWPIWELVDEIRLYSDKIEKDIINSELEYWLFLTDKDNQKIEKTGKWISIANEIFNLIYKNLNFKTLEDSLLLKKEIQDLKIKKNNSEGVINDQVEDFEKINIYGIKNELDFAFSNDTCVSSHRQELYNWDFIPLRITDALDENIIWYIWLKEAYIDDVWDVLVLTDIHPILSYRWYFNPEDFYKKTIKILKKYVQNWWYNQLVMTTVYWAQSNDAGVAKIMKKDFKNKERYTLDKKIFMPEGSSYDISNVVIL